MKVFEKIMDQVINPIGNSPIHNCLLSITNHTTNNNFSTAKGFIHNQPVNPGMLFKTGSMTKPFTACIVLQLMEQGFFDLDNCFFDLLDDEKKNILSELHFFKGKDYSRKITINHLLQHYSGLCDYFSQDERFLLHVMDHPGQSWNSQSIMEKYFELDLNKQAFFEPGVGFHYADTNYLLLAILAEQVTSKPFHTLLEERIFNPLSLTDTYLEYHTPSKNTQVLFPYFGSQSLEHINTSFDWGGGGLVSGLKDLTYFIYFLSKGNLFKNTSTLALMIDDLVMTKEGPKRKAGYGMGIQQKEIHGQLFIGHSSAYGSQMFYSPDLNTSIILTLNQSSAILKSEWMLKSIIKQLVLKNE